MADIGHWQKMRVTRIPAVELGDTDVTHWRQIQQSCIHFESPYLSPEFTLLAAQARKNVYVSILESDQGTAGYFSFEDFEGQGVPTGNMLSDCQGVVIAQGEGREWCPADLIRQSRLAQWTFTNLIATQEPFRPYHRRVAPSHVICLRNGFSGYLAGKGSQTARKSLARERRACRNIGPLRYEFHVQDSSVLNALLSCKSSRYKVTGHPDIFERNWTRDLLERIHATQKQAFAGILSVLYAGDTAIAWHLGMRSHSVLHYWFPCYSPDFAPYSPGLLLLFRILQSASDLGLRAVELGKGTEEYKLRFANSATLVAEGVVHPT